MDTRKHSKTIDTGSFVSRNASIALPALSRRNSSFAYHQHFNVSGIIGGATVDLLDGQFHSHVSNSVLDSPDDTVPTFYPVLGQGYRRYSAVKLEDSHSNRAPCNQELNDERKDGLDRIRPYSYSAPMSTPDEMEELMHPDVQDIV